MANPETPFDIEPGLIMRIAQDNKIPLQEGDIVVVKAYYGLRDYTSAERDQALKDGGWDDATRERAASVFTLVKSEIAKKAVESTTQITNTDVTDEGQLETDIQEVIIPSFTTLLKNVPNKFSEDLSDHELQLFHKASARRLELWNKSLSVKCGIDPERITEEWFLGLLSDFAEQTPTPTKDYLPSNFRQVYAAMLWEDLQGAPIKNIQKAAKEQEHYWGYGVTTLSYIRQQVERYAIATRKEKHDAPVTSPEPKELLFSGKSPEDLRHLSSDLHKRNRTAELKEQDNHTRLEVRQNGHAERRRVANLLHRYLGGNVGAYRQIFSLSPEVLVSDDDMRVARVGLLSVVGEMVRPSISNVLPSELRIDIDTEARWIVLLSGKELVVTEEGGWALKSIREPHTIQALRDMIYRQSLGSKSSKLTPEEIERTVISTIDKVIEYKKHRMTA